MFAGYNAQNAMTEYKLNELLYRLVGQREELREAIARLPDARKEVLSGHPVDDRLPGYGRSWSRPKYSDALTPPTVPSGATSA